MKKTSVDPLRIAITPIVLHLYSVESHTTPGHIYTVDVQNNTCDCRAGLVDQDRVPEKQVGCWHRLYAAAYHRGVEEERLAAGPLERHDTAGPSVDHSRKRGRRLEHVSPYDRGETVMNLTVHPRTSRIAEGLEVSVTPAPDLSHCGPLDIVVCVIFDLMSPLARTEVQLRADERWTDSQRLFLIEQALRRLACYDNEYRAAYHQEHPTEEHCYVTLTWSAPTTFDRIGPTEPREGQEGSQR